MRSLLYSPAPAIRLGLLLLFTLFIVVGSGCRKTVTVTSPLQGGKQLVSIRGGFSVAYPPSWHIREEKGASGPVIALVSAQDSADDEFSETLSITVDTLQPGSDLNTFAGAKMRDLQDCDGFDLHNKQDFLGKMPGKSITFSYNVNGVIMSATAHFFVHGNKGYALAGVATPRAFPRYEPTFNQIAASFTATP